MSDDRDTFFAELQAPEPGLASRADADSDDGWFEQAASDELGADGAAPRAAEAIGAAALTLDRELAPRASRRRRRPAERTATIAAPRHPHRTRRVAALAAVGVLLVLGAAVVLNSPDPSSPDSASSGTGRGQATKAAATANPSTSPAPQPAAPQPPPGQPAAGEQRDRLNAGARRPRRRARRGLRRAGRGTVPAPAAASSKSTRLPSAVASRAVVPGAARRPGAPRLAPPTTPSFTPGDLPVAPSAR